MLMSRQLIEATLSLCKKQICMHCISPVIANTIYAYMIVFHILTRFFSLPYFLLESRSVPHHMKSQPSIVSCYTLYIYTYNSLAHSHLPILSFWFSLGLQFEIYISRGCAPMACNKVSNTCLVSMKMHLTCIQTNLFPPNITCY